MLRGLHKVAALPDFKPLAQGCPGSYRISPGQCVMMRPNPRGAALMRGRHAGDRLIQEYRAAYGRPDV